jgi:hypothetical protein
VDRAGIDARRTGLVAATAMPPRWGGGDERGHDARTDLRELRPRRRRGRSAAEPGEIET